MTIPALVVGGYLGAGKTTLINRLLRNADGRRITVLVNDFGSINIDADLIENRNGDTVSLTNGCACCTIGSDLLDAARKAVAGLPDMLVVEASGVAEPGRMVMTLLGVEGLAAAETLTVVDCSTVQQRMRDKFVGNLVTSQINMAAMILVNRLPADDQTASRTTNLIEAAAPSARMLDSPEEVIRLLVMRTTKPARREDGADAGNSSHPEVLEAVTLILADPVDPDRLEAACAMLPASVHRAKGFVSIRAWDGQVCLSEVQYSGNRLSVRPIKSVSGGETAGLVLIGTESAAGMAAISARLTDALTWQPT